MGVINVKRTSLFLLSVLLIMSFITGCSTEQKTGGTDVSSSTGGEVITMKLANSNPPGDIRDKVCVKFAELVDEKTNGKVKIEVYSGGSLGDWRDTIEGLSMGINEIVIESPSSLNPYSETASIDTLPYVYRDKEHWKQVMTSDLGRELLEVIGKEGGFKILAPQYRGAKITTSTKQINSIDDVQGLKMRVPNNKANIEQWKYLGAAPTPLALTETFTALQQGTVEGQDNAVIESYGLAFYDVCKYLALTNHCYISDTFLFDEDYFENLEPQIQSAIEEAANEAAAWRTAEVEKSELEYLKKFEDEGVTITEPDLEPFKSKLDGFVEKEYPHLTEWVNRIQEVK